MTVTRDNDTITVHVPITFNKRGGRKQIVLPDGTSSWAPPRARVDNTMVKAIARGFRWRKLLETGVHTTIEDIAAAEKISASYVSRILRLTLLAPSIVDAILDGRQGPEMTLATLMKPFPLEWDRQISKASGS
ncbi:hypothetical protein [Chelativorans sp. Marseille-P2723]|uniref:hypothetical protein n=1 Tax=Chelativorans sp. Marseille-P2723 TaxID=2709133 RepID=UPI0015708004|nr:hypothetical protein [Chelativorans sp. Marseille-P2723]